MHGAWCWQRTHGTSDVNHKIVTSRSTAAYRATHLQDDDVAVFRGYAIFHIVVTEEVVQRPERGELGDEHDVGVGTVHADKPHEVWVASKPEQDVRFGAKGRRQDLGGRDHGGTRRARDPELGAVHDLGRATADFLEDADVSAVNLLAESFAKLFDAVPQGVVWGKALAVQHHVARWARGIGAEPDRLWGGGSRCKGSHAASVRACHQSVIQARSADVKVCLRSTSRQQPCRHVCVCAWHTTRVVPLLDGCAFKSMAVYGAHGVVHEVE